LFEQLLVFVASLAALLIAARFFTSGAERIGLSFGMSPFVVGVLIVAIGTSLPELVASLISVRAGTSEIVSGNVLGANATNLLLLLGAVSVVTPGRRIVLGEQYLFIDLHFMLGSIILLSAVMIDGLIGRAEGSILIFVYVVYITYQVREGRTETAEATAAMALGAGSRSIPGDFAILAASGAAIYFAGTFTVSSLQQLANEIGISPAIASVTILSIGTTLPELAVSITAARRGMAALAIGNILGSCIFNALVVAGSAGTLGTVIVPHSLLEFALPFVAASTLLFYLLTQDKRISRWEGMLMLAMFALFILKMSGVA